jgi:nucleotide-binding universal stress UspA family protein
MTDAPTSPLIIVGVDGSPEAAAALAWAVDEARLHGARLHVVHAYPVLSALTGSTGDELYAHLETDAKELLQRIAAAGPSVEDLSVNYLGVPGNPAEVLIEASREAKLLVVGSRGLGGFMGLVMGSVSSQCVHHSHCPVLVVREEH